MNNQNINKLAGQVRALEDVVIGLVCALEMKGSIDGPVLTDYLNGYADRYRPASGHEDLVEVAVFAQESMRKIAGLIEAARAGRQ